MLSHLRMSGTSFRPRQLDVNRPIPVIRKEVEDDDMMTISRGVPELPTGMEMAEEAERHLQEIMNRDMFQNASADIPTPVVKIVEGWDTEVDPHPLNRPQTYIRYEDKTEEEWDQIVEYDLDDEDMEFLAKVNAGKDLITADKLETMIDRFEKERSRNGDVEPSFSSIEMIFPDMKTALVQIVFNYWLKKRATNEWVNPMIYRLQRPPDSEDPSPYKAFRTRNEEKLRRKSRKNDQASFMKMKQVRHEMERARTLLEMIKKREKLKRDRTQLLIDIFDKQLERVLNGEEPIFLEGEPSSPEPASPPIPQDLIDEYGHFEKPIQKVTSTSTFSEPPTTTTNNKRKKKQQRTLNNHTTSASSRHSRVVETPVLMAPAPPPPPTDIYELNLPIPEDESMLMDELIHVDEIPSSSTGNIFLGPKIPTFRGRVRMGRGGRILFDRRKNKPLSSGIVPYIETDEEYSPRISSMIEYGSTSICQSDPLLLLKKLEALIDFKRKLDSKN